MNISIVMCTYNGELYLEEQLDSLRLQTRPADEVLICDDCSTDNTVEVVNSYIEKYSLQGSWQFSVNESNKGYADNFHDVMLYATGDLIFFCDQDDVWHLDKVERMVSAFEEKKDMILLCTGKHDFLNNVIYSGNTGSMKNMNITEVTSTPQILSCKKIMFSDKMMYLRASGCVMAFRRTALKDFERYWYSGWAHDEYIWKMALCFDGIYWSDEILMERRVHQLNTSLVRIHNYPKRVQYIKCLQKSYEAMLTCLNTRTGSLRNMEWQELTKKHIEACKLRLDLLEKKKFWNVVRLFTHYQETLYDWKNVPVEVFLSIKRG